MVKESELVDQLGSLATQLIKCRKQSERNKHIHTVLSNTPYVQYRDGSMGQTDCFLKVKAQTPDNKEFELAGEYNWGSNYAHSQPRCHKFGNEELCHLSYQSTVIQLAYLVKVYGKPLKVSAEYREHHDWSGQDYVDENWKLKFKFP